MLLQPASSALNDEEFLAAFHSCSLPPACFRHADHLRLGWIHVHRETLQEAINHVCRGIRAYAAHLGKPEIYHETITAAWVRLIASHDELTFADFLIRNEYRLNTDLLYRFWSQDLLLSQRARAEWVLPDRMQLPLPVSN
jgi:hypothetical protein